MPYVIRKEHVSSPLRVTGSTCYDIITNRYAILLLIVIGVIDIIGCEQLFGRLSPESDAAVRFEEEAAARVSCVIRRVMCRYDAV